jgi:hypothetical protein
MTKSISFARDIRPLFRPADIECMKSVPPAAGPFDLSRYEDVKARADRIYAMLIATGEFRMPFGGPYWSDENLKLFKEWLANDCPP